MNCDNSTSTEQEGEYPVRTEVLDRYLTGERPIDDVVQDPDFQKEARKMCNRIAGSLEAGKDLLQAFCQQLLRRDCEGPRRSSKQRAKSLRAVGFRTTNEFWAYLHKSAKNLARSIWRKRKRRDGLAQMLDLTPDDARRLRDKDVSPETRYMLGEILTLINDLPERKRLAIAYWILDYPTRDIARILSVTGYPCTHVSVRAWVSEVLSQVRGCEVRSIKKAS